MPIKYTPPTTQDLAALRERLGLKQREMAELFWLGGDHQWRKYTGGHTPRELNPHMAFVAAARLTLSPEEFARVVDKMAEFGAHVEQAPDGEPRP